MLLVSVNKQGSKFLVDICEVVMLEMFPEEEASKGREVRQDQATLYMLGNQ
jgi:hypothetical protein